MASWKPPPGPMRAPQATRLSIPDFDDGDDEADFTQPWDVGTGEELSPIDALLEATTTFRPGSLESQYAGLFFEALSEGEIGEEERERLDLAASALGLSEERRAALEEGWRSAYQGGAVLGAPDLPIIVDDHPETETSSLPRTFLARPTPAPPSASRRPTPYVMSPGVDADPDVPDLVMMLEQAMQRDDVDACYRIASVLCRRKGAPAVAIKTVESLRPATVPAPLRSASEETWLSVTEGNESFLLTSSIFREIAGAALLARASAFRLDGRRIDTSAEHLGETRVTAVRAFAWCAAHLGVPCPSIHVAPQQAKGIDFVPTLPPSIVLGRPVLEAEPFEVAFECARHLVLHRPEHFITMLVPDVAALEDVFHAALLLVVTDLPIERDLIARALLNRDALRPAVDHDGLERLRHLVRTQLLLGLPDLNDWVDVVERTADRVGLLLSGDLRAAARVLSREPNGQERLRRLESFWIGRLAGSLRAELGLALAPHVPAVT